MYSWLSLGVAKMLENISAMYRTLQSSISVSVKSYFYLSFPTLIKVMLLSEKIRPLLGSVQLTERFCRKTRYDTTFFTRFYVATTTIIILMCDE